MANDPRRRCGPRSLRCGDKKTGSRLSTGPRSCFRVSGGRRNSIQPRYRSVNMKSAAPRTKDRSVSREAFDLMLAWLDSDRERAGQKYEEIRYRLIKIFV